MALHAEMGAEGEHLVGAVLIGQESCRSGRQAESFTMPLKNGARLAGESAQPMAGNIIVFAEGATPADFLDRVFADDATERLADQLSTQAMADDRYIFCRGIADQGTNRFDPRQRVVDAHRAAHETQAGKAVDRGRHRIALVDGDQLPWNALLLKEYGKIAGTFSRGMTNDGDGLHAWRNDRKVKLHFTLLALIACLLSGGAAAQTVGLAGLMGSKALLMINGGEPKAVAVGQVLDGVKVVSIQGDQAIVEVGGKQRPLRIGQHAVGAGGGDGAGKVIMTADLQGHYYVNGSINGSSIRFLVDTGATMISLGASDARRMGLDIGRGQKGMAQTANGQAAVTKVKLDTVSIGDVTLHNVDALVHQNEMPMALLGMSFLNRMEMQRDSNTMTLKKRY